MAHPHGSAWRPKNQSRARGVRIGVLLAAAIGGLIAGVLLWNRADSSPEAPPAAGSGGDELEPPTDWEPSFAYATEEEARTVVREDAPSRVETDSGFALDVPLGAFERAVEVTVGRVASPPRPLSLAREVVAAFEVRAGSQQVFASPVVLELPFPADALDPRRRPEEALVAAWWDDKAKLWRDVPATLDAERRKLIVRTQHLSLWSIQRWFPTWNVLRTPRFTINYAPRFHAALPPLTELQTRYLQVLIQKNGWAPDGQEVANQILRMRKNAASAAGIHATGLNYAGLQPDALAAAGVEGGVWPAYASDPGLPPYVRDTAVLLDLAFRRYEAAGLRMPATSIYVDLLPGRNQRSGLTGTIDIGLDAVSWEQLQVNAAHELFHAVQNQYYFSLGMGGDRMWWIEATAEYAAWRIACNRPLERRVEARYPERSITYAPPELYDWVAETVANRQNPFSEHHYDTAYLIERMLLSGTGAATPRAFVELFEGVVARDPARGSGVLIDAVDLFAGSDIQLPLQAVERRVQETRGASLADAYRDFAAWLSFTDHACCSGAIAPTAVAGQPLNQAPGTPGNRAEERWTATVPPNYTAALRRIQAANACTVQVTAPDGVPPGIHVDLYRLPGNARGSGVPARVGSLDSASGDTAIEIEIEPQDGVYAIAANSSRTQAKVKLNVALKPGELQFPFVPTHMGIDYEVHGSFIRSLQNDFTGESFQDREVAASATILPKLATPIIPVTVGAKGFSARYEYQQYTGRITITGTFSADRREITSLTVDDMWLEKGDDGSTAKRTTRIVLDQHRIPLDRPPSAVRIGFSGTLDPAHTRFSYRHEQDLSVDVVSIQDGKEVLVTQKKSIRSRSESATGGTITISFSPENFGFGQLP